MYDYHFNSNILKLGLTFLDFINIGISEALHTRHQNLNLINLNPYEEKFYLRFKIVRLKELPPFESNKKHARN
jgi:hypothetical protein